MDEIKSDIDAVREIIDDLHKISLKAGDDARVTQHALNQVLTGPGYSPQYRHVARWCAFGEGTVFLQDANNLIMRTGELVEALHYLKEKIPGIRRITSYGRSSTIARKSLDDLKSIHAAGLDRIHIGLESGCDAVLRFVKKAVTAAQHIEAGRKVIEAGMTLSEYIMPGLGGQALSTEHALDTARVLNAIDPHFIRIRSLRIPPHTPLYQDLIQGRFKALADDDVVREIRLLIEHLEGIHSLIASDHIMNLLEEVGGQLPHDKARMLQVIDDYLGLDASDRLLYRLGRRGGALHSTGELNDPGRRRRLENAKRDLESKLGKDLESIITEMGDQYI